jgi:type I restriction enzyme S subunit
VKLDAGEFELRPFEKVALPQSDKGKRIKQRDYLPRGKLPVVDQGQSDIGGYTDDESMCFSGSLPVVIFGDHTRAVKLVNHPFVVGADGIKIFSPATDVLPKYLYYWMKSAPIENRGYGRHYQYLRKLSVPVPSLAKQQAIVDEIEKQFSRLDEAVANLQRVKANLKRYKASVLKAAVEGRLVETEASIAQREGRSYETGEQLLQRILEDRRSRWSGKAKYKEPALLDAIPEAEPPESWTWSNFEQVSSSERHALKAGPFGSALKKEFYVPVGYKIYGQEQVIAGDHKSGDYYISEEKYTELQNCAVKPGDILVSLVGTTGKVLVLPDGAEPGIINPRLIKLSLNPKFVIAQYASYYLQSAPARRFFKLQAHGGTMEILNLGIVKALPICLPPIAEQTRIVAEVDRHLSIVREVEVEVDDNLQRAQALRQATLVNAFSMSKTNGR